MNQIEPTETSEQLEVKDPQQPGTRTLEHRRESFRGWIVILLLLMIFALYLTPILSGSADEKLWSLTEKIITGMIGLLGSAIAFYFREK